MRPFYRSTIVAHVLAVIFFVILAGIGLIAFRDYGIGIDEYSQIDLGRVNYRYVTRGSQELLASYDRYYGPAFETALYGVSPVAERLLHAGLLDSRHAIEYFYFAGAVLAWYLLIMRITRSPWYGLLGAVMLVVSPRIFAESFYNSKDMVFLSTGIYLLYSLWYFLDGSAASLLVHAALSGYAMAVRPQAILFIVGSLFALFLVTDRRVFWRRALWYAALTFVFAWLCFPVFWQHPFASLSGFWFRMAEPVGVPTFFGGKFYISPDIPWYHLPVWIAITSPLSVIAGAIAGSVWFVVRGRKDGQSKKDKAYALFAVMCWISIGTLVFSVLLRARTYDGWRHIYYMYPALVGFFVYFVRRIMSPSFAKAKAARIIVPIVLFAIALDAFFLLRFMVRNHPNEYVYFNVLAGGYKHAKENFDFDYWGISLRQTRTYLLSLRAKGARVYIEEADFFPYVKREIESLLTERGLRITDDPSGADIYVTLHRDNKMPPPQRFRRVWGVSVEGADLTTVYAADSYFPSGRFTVY